MDDFYQNFEPEYEPIDMDCEDWALDENLKEIPGTGRRFQRAKRCEADSLLSGNCVGVKGHKGPHWCYDQYGCYVHWWDEITGPGPDPNIAHVSSPDGSQGYVSPAQREHELHLSFTKERPIEDEPKE